MNLKSLDFYWGCFSIAFCSW